MNMKLYNILLSIIFMTASCFASNIPGAFAKSVRCDCPPIEHVFIQQLVAKYAHFYPGSPLEVKNNYENFSWSQLVALARFGQDIKYPLVNSSEGGDIVPVQMKSGKFVLPVYKNDQVACKQQFLRKFDTKRTWDYEMLVTEFQVYVENKKVDHK